jgi:AcrR family transcriptional regulator
MATRSETTGAELRRHDGRRAQQLSPRATETVQRLHDAANRVFASNGFHDTSVDQIVAEAQLSRGTFYKYFKDKLDLLRMLSDACEVRIFEVLEAMPRDASNVTFSKELRAWLPNCIGVLSDSSGIYVMWMDSNVGDESIRSAGNRVWKGIQDVFVELFETVDRSYALEVKAASLMFVALIRAVPQRAADSADLKSEEQLIETLALFVERGLLNPGHAS